MVRRLQSPDGHQLNGPRRRENRSVRTVGVGQVDADPLHQPSRELSRRARSSSTVFISTTTQKTIDTVRREVGMVFQQFNLFPHLTVLENCTLAPMRARGTSRAQEAEATARRLLERVRVSAIKRTNIPRSSPAASSNASRSPARCAWSRRSMLFDEPTSRTRSRNGEGSAGHDDR